MVIINPWGSYDPDDIPDLNPRDEEEARGCFAVIVAYVLSTVVFVAIECLVLHLRLNYGIALWLFGVLTVCGVVIYVVIMIFLFRLLDRVMDRVGKRRRKNKG